MLLLDFNIKADYYLLCLLFLDLLEEGAGAAALGGVDTAAIDRVVEAGVALVRGRGEMLGEVVVWVPMHVLVEGL